MRRCKLSGLALLVAVVFSSVLSASASAAKLPELLGQTNPATYTGANDGTTKLEFETSGGTTIVCASASATGTQETDTGGTFHITIKGCKSAGASCTSSGDSTEEILSLGKFDLVDDFLSTEVSKLGVAIVFLLGTGTEFSCSALVKIKLTGDVICLILEPLTSATTHLFHCIHQLNSKSENEGKGVQLDKVFWGDGENEEIKPELLTSINGATGVPSSELALGTVVFSVNVAFMNE